MLPPYCFYWFRIDNKHMTEPQLDEALMRIYEVTQLYSCPVCSEVSLAKIPTVTSIEKMTNICYFFNSHCKNEDPFRTATSSRNGYKTFN